MDPVKALLLPKLEGVRFSGGSWMAKCPAHDDGKASLHISRGTKHPCVLKCHAGCDPVDILKAVGLTWDDLCTPKEDDASAPKGGGRGVIATYDYTDAAGKLLFQVVRMAGKRFLQRRPDPREAGEWIWKRGDVQPVLYRLPKVIGAVSGGEIIYVCYADDTEVLTPGGWTPMAKLEPTAQVAQYDAGQVSFVTPSARQVFDYAGPMVSIAADWSGLLVTPDHRVLCQWARCAPVTIPARDVNSGRWLPVAGVREGCAGGPTADEARLLAAWQADGVNCARGYRVAWNLRKPRKIERLRQLFTALGIEWREQVFPSMKAWTYLSIDRREVPLLDRLPGKRFGWDILDWPPASRHALLDELGYWDGDRPGREGVRYFTADEQCAEVVSAVAATTGWGSILRRDDRPARPEQGPQWVVSLVPRDWRNLGNAPECEDYDGRVYCLTVPSGYLVTRRQGKVTVCGNCEGEKDVHALENAGVTATCNPGGAGKWLPEFSEYLRDAIVVVVADKDAPGQAHARAIMDSLDGIAAAVEVVEAVGELKDAAAHLGAGHAIADFEVTHEAVREPPADLSMDLYDFLAVVDPPDDWVIPGVLERMDRLIWTGFEGLGKSVMVRQLAICAAAGIHPFTGQSFEPKRVLFIDCENPDKMSRAHFRKLERIARGKGRPVPVNHLRILQHPSGVDLTREPGPTWLIERITAYRPDLLVVGPLYKLHATDANEESAARAIVTALDAARIKAGCALITEAHAGHGSGANGRSVRPAGSSLFLRWPEFGFGLRPLGEPDEEGRNRDASVLPWRGSRAVRHWPPAVRWGDRGDWPWVPTKPMAYFEESDEDD